MKTDYCAYPPEIAADLEITEQRDGARTVYIVGSAFVGRYLLLRATEYQVVGLIDGARAAGAVCAEFDRAAGADFAAYESGAGFVELISKRGRARVPRNARLLQVRRPGWRSGK